MSKRNTMPRQGLIQTGAVAFSVGLTICLLASTPGRAQAVEGFVEGHPVFRIRTADGDVGQGFGIQNPRDPTKCLVVTVEHVAPPGVGLTLSGERRTRSTPVPRAVFSQAKYLDAFAQGLVVVAPDPSSDLGDCAPWPRQQGADPRLTGEQIGRLVYAGPDGRALSLRAAQLGDARGLATFPVRGVDDSIGPGLSGSLYVVGGVPLGLASSLTGEAAQIIAFNALRPNPQYASGSDSSGWGAFDERQLPPDIRQWIGQVRDVYAQSKAVSAEARDAAFSADAAAVAALRAAPASPEGRLTLKAGVYYGGIEWLQKGEGRPRGAGVLLSPDRKRQIECVWKDNMVCDGVGRIRTLAAANDTVLTWEGNICGIDRCKIGRVETPYDQIWYQNYTIPSYLVLILTENGRRLHREMWQKAPRSFTRVDWDEHTGELVGIADSDNDIVKDRTSERVLVPPR